MFITLFTRFSQYLINLPQNRRRFLLICLDIFIVYLSIIASSWIVSGQSIKYSFQSNLLIKDITLSLIIIFLYSFSGQYKGLTRYVGASSIYILSLRNLIILIFIYLIRDSFNFGEDTIREFLVFWIFLIGLSSLIRFSIRDIILRFQSLKKSSKNERKKRVVIYGAGVGGAQLAASLKITGEYDLISFIDDNSMIWNRSLNSIPIQSVNILKNNKYKFDQILIAIPSLSKKNRKFLVERLEEFKIPIYEIPSVEELTSGIARINEIRRIDVLDLLGREAVPPIKKLLEPAIKGYSIVVTGAGGSIGSELCRQIINLRPRHLIMIESNEPSLYSIYEEIKILKKESLKVKAILGSTSDMNLMEKIFSKFDVDLIFHAAAYKHVPLVEENPVHGLFNNVFSTKAICDAASKFKVSKVVLISSDKAVRPTNVMGASKRLSELIFQAKAFEEDKKKDSNNKTFFTSVRFGNVLGSSGSVVPLFRKQIDKGGPITLTHKNMVRYFMTIPEAVQLVIQASVLAEGGDIFLLDMGNPVRIYDLAKKMISLSGLSLKDNSNPKGDIQIVCTGIRAGEKLYEELLIDDNSKSTKHPLIFQAFESNLEPSYLWHELEKLEKSLRKHDEESSLKLLSKLVKEWESNV